VGVMGKRVVYLKRIEANVLREDAAGVVAGWGWGAVEQGVAGTTEGRGLRERKIGKHTHTHTNRHTQAHTHTRAHT
jgi:hypothetical protein